MGVKVYKENKCPAKKDVLLKLIIEPGGNVSIQAVKPDGSLFCYVAEINKDGIYPNMYLEEAMEAGGYDTSWTTFDSDGSIAMETKP